VEEHSLRILIADDNDSDRLILKTIVSKQGHTVLTAADGLEAVEVFRRERPDIVLLDALMPNLDGMGAARQIKQIAGEDIVPIIFLTSLTDAASLAECLEAGGDDFLSKPYNRVILQAKINAFARMRKLHAEVQSQRDQIILHHDHLIQEQEVAKAVFDNIAHHGCINSPNIKSLLSPMAIFNGDMLLAARRPSGGMVVLLGDFTGHGLPAAIGAMPASEIFYGMARKGFSIQDILREINKKLKSILPVGVFCCTAAADIDFYKGLVEIWNGGLPDIFLYRSKNRGIERIKSKRLPLGVLNDQKFNSDTEVFEVQLGDKLYMWSDGIHEATNPVTGEMFGQEALEAVFQTTLDPELLFDSIKKSVEDFVQGQAQGDDHTMVEVTMVNESVLGDPNKSQGGKIQAGGPMEWTVDYELRPASLKAFNPLPLVTHLLLEVPGLRPHSAKLYTILSELYSNALEHGVMGLSSELKSSPTGFADYYRERQARLEQLENGYVRFHLNHTATEGGGELIIRLIDSGPGFDWQRKYNNDHKTEGYCGRGIPLIRTMCKSFNYVGDGNEVEAVFSWTYD